MGRVPGEMALVFTFLLGMGNFAWHRAVIESGHRMVAEIPSASLRALRLASLTLEFTLLCGALWAAQEGHTHWTWAYLVYSLINGGAAWMMISHRV